MKVSPETPAETNGANPHKGHRGLRRIVRATGHSMAGLADGWRHESAFRQEVALALVMLPLSLWLGRNTLERALLAGSVLLVLIVELLNSAVEAAVDRISLDLHELSRRAKDLGSAAVLLSLVLCGVIWAAVIWDRMG